MRLCLENLPTADAIPNEPETFALLREYEGSPLAYWHDWGHGQIRHELGLVHQGMLLKRLRDRIGGMHLHDVRSPLEGRKAAVLEQVKDAFGREFGNVEVIPERPGEPTVLANNVVVARVEA